MTTLRQCLTDDHRHCDDLFAAAEKAVAAKDFATARKAFDGFAQAMREHFASEENTLFPRFEAATGSDAGPTRVMRLEHQQMRALLDEAGKALAVNAPDAYLGLADTLLIMMQQHNMKEENVLYPMCDRHLAPEVPQLVAAIRSQLGR